jgi:hypothetical protein
MRILILFLLFSSISWSRVIRPNKTLDTYITMLSKKDKSLIGEVFTQRYLKEIGGYKKIENLMNKKGLFVPKKYTLKSKKSHQRGIFFVNLSYANKYSKSVSIWFRLVETKDGKVKIDGLAADM